MGEDGRDGEGMASLREKLLLKWMNGPGWTEASTCGGLVVELFV